MHKVGQAGERIEARGHSREALVNMPMSRGHCGDRLSTGVRLLLIEHRPNVASERLLVRCSLQEGVPGRVTTGKRPTARGLRQEALGKRPLTKAQREAGGKMMPSRGHRLDAALERPLVGQYP